MGKLFYAQYEGTDCILGFDTSQERDEYVREEKIVHPECKRVSSNDVDSLIKDRKFVYDSGFGCMVAIS